MNSGQEVASQLIVSGGYAPEVLEPAEAAFDDVSAFVGTFVEAMDDDTIGFIGDYGLGASTNDFGVKAVAIIALVGDERAHGWGERETSGAAVISASWPGVR